MTKHDVIDRIAQGMTRLDDEKLEDVARYIEHLAGGSVYATLPAAEKRKIDEALDSLDRGEGVPGEQVFRALRARIDAARKS